MYLIRLDDASQYMDIERWNRIANLLNKYSIKPIVGVIPSNQDESLLSKYNINLEFWNYVKRWELENWTIALHGYTHVYSSNDGGINPVNSYSEFAGLSLVEQRKKIEFGIQILKEHNINPKIFFAPAHTFDNNTLEALKLESDIRTISDTVANDVYKMKDFYFIPQQSGRVRWLPFKVTTFCYHPNNMREQDFRFLEKFLNKNKDKFVDFKDLTFEDRGLNGYDKVLKYIYFLMRRIRNIFRAK